MIPIANEDDAVSVTMSMFSDNDELASLIAELVNADKLIILTDIDGLYNGHPDAENSNVVSHVNQYENLDKYIQKNTKGEAEGRGGTGSKLEYAQRVAAKNIPTFIAKEKKERTIIDIIDGKNIGTRVAIHEIT